MVSDYALVIKMICPNCHRIYEDGNVFCVECGVRLVPEGFGSSNPMERHSSRFKSSKPRNGDPPIELSSTDKKLDVLIMQNRELIRQNSRIIELLERLNR
ncbi:hypothetical protein [Methanobrevibacter sp.]|uniref:hypothetical protein n=1 Tax=Methanobrevibacter sp. TaxID=66852 RepID=UPI00388F111A